MKKLLFISIILSFCSTLGHFYLAKRSYQLEAGVEKESTLCTIGESFNCNSALLSPYAKIFNLSLSNFGFSFNLVLAGLLIAFLLLGVTTSFWKNTIFYLSGFIALSSLIMGFISILYQLLCPICWTLYLLSFLTTGILFWSFRFDLSNPLHFILKNIKQNKIYILCATLFFLSFFIHIFFTNQLNLKDQKELLAAQFQDWQYAKKVEISQAPLIKKGSGKGIMRIVEFADFLCPACKQTEPALKKFLKYHPDVDFYFYLYPLDGSCNPSIKIKRSGLSCELSKAIICAQSQKQTWLLYDFIFKHQKAFLSAQAQPKKIQNLMKQMLSSTQINKSDFELCMKDKQTLEKINKSALAGKELNIKGTPSFFVNEKPIYSNSKLLILKHIYEHLNSNKP